MKITITARYLADLLQKDHYAKWTDDAALALAEYYENLEEETGVEYEPDLVAIRCTWTEYSGYSEVADAYKIFAAEGAEADEWEYKVDEVLGDNTQFIKINNGGYLVMDF